MKFFKWIPFLLIFTFSSSAQDHEVNDFELELQKLEKGEWIKEEKQIENIEALNLNEDQLTDQISVGQAAVDKSLPTPDQKKESTLPKPRRIRSR